MIMKIQLVLLTFLAFNNFNSFSQKPYVLELKAEKWDLKPEVFYIDKIVDNRQDKKKAGDALVNGKIVDVIFPQSIEKDLLSFIENSMTNDTSKIPLTFSLEKFLLNETGTISNHKAGLTYQIKIYFKKGENNFLLYETSGNPHFIMKGPFQHAHEKNISSALKSTITSFNEWINQNSDLPFLAHSVKITFDPEPRFQDYENGDTIAWNEKYKLTWDDFQGKARASNYMAESNCIFTYRAEPEVSKRILNLRLRINACFDKNNSWVKDGEKKTPLLEHEQLHFDICELYIRMLKNKITSMVLDPLDYNSQIQVAFNEIWNQYQQEQQKYDDETQHGIIKEKQDAWKKKIEAALAN